MDQSTHLVRYTADDTHGPVPHISASSQHVVSPQIPYRGVERTPLAKMGRPQFTAVIYLGKVGTRSRRHYVSTVYCTPEEAARGHDRAAIAVFGPDLAITNFPQESYGTEVLHFGLVCFCTKYNYTVKEMYTVGKSAVESMQTHICQAKRSSL